MKKFLKVTLIAAGSLLGLMILLPMIFRSRIEEEVKKRISQEVDATVEWASFSASLFRGFPNLSASLLQLSVTTEALPNADTIATLDRFELRMNPFGIFRQHIDIHSVLLYRPDIKGEILENGEPNWDMWQTVESEEDPMESGDRAEGGAGSSMSLSLQKLVISEGKIRYSDRMNGSDILVERLNLELRGDFTDERTKASMNMDLKGLDVMQNGLRYMKDGALSMELEADADMLERKISIRRNELSLNGMDLEVEGEFSLPDETGLEMDLQFRTKETSFHTLLSLIPAIYLNDFESLSAEGTFTMAGNVEGIWMDTLLPDVNLALLVSDGSFTYPDLPRDVSDVQIDLEVDFRGVDRDASTVTLDRLHMVLGGDPFDLQLSMAHPYSDMYVAGKAMGTIDFSKIGDVLPLKDVRLGGMLKTDLQWNTRMSAIEEERFEEVALQGTLTVTGFELEFPEFPVPVQLHQLEMVFTPRLVQLQSLEMELGSSDLQMKGELYNFIPYLFDHQVVHGSLQVTSEFFDSNELFFPVEDSISEPGGPLVDSTEAQLMTQAPSDSLALPGRFEIPELIDFNMDLAMNQLLVDQLAFRDLEGNLRVGEGVAHVDRIKADVLEGRIDLSGKADPRGEYMKVDALVQVDGLDIPTAYEKVISVERLVPMARYCRGTANLTMRYSSLMDHSFTPLYGSINAKGRVFTKGLQIYNMQGFVNINDLVRNEKIRRMAPDEVEIDFTISDGRVQVAPFDVDFDDSKITVGGSHGIDHSLDYLVEINIAKKDLGPGALSMVNSMTFMAKAAGLKVVESDVVNVKATIKGTFEKPAIKTDLSGNMGAAGASVGEQLRNKAKEEIESVEEQVREEASQRADQIIADAETEAARIVDEARQKGDQLVKEAELQGDQLIEEAGDNALKKMAAERAAKELTTQAQKQSDRMLEEAEKKAAEIVERARGEASRIK